MTQGNDWIDVKDKLPEVGKEVLCITKTTKAIVIRSIETIPSMSVDNFKYNYSHWQPLPAPPNKK